MSSAPGARESAHLLPGFPSEWAEWPTEIIVRFTLVEGNCVYRALYDEYARDRMEEAARTLFDPCNRSIFVHYCLQTVEGVVPAYAWYEEHPLRRRGPDGRARKRGAVVGACPFEYEPDRTLLEVWNQPLGVYGCRSRFRLRVGGRTREDARRNWVACAKPLRLILRDVESAPPECREVKGGSFRERLLASLGLGAP